MKSAWSSTLVVMLALSILLAGCSAKEAPAGPRAVFLTDGKETVITLEVADSVEEQQQGLMFREILDPDAGMLFVWEDEQPRAFWMKNTFIPLDMLFIDSHLEVVDLFEDVPPCEADPCPVYPSGQPAQYVLEVNAGFARENGITPGAVMRYEG